MINIKVYAHGHEESIIFYKEDITVTVITPPCFLEHDDYERITLALNEIDKNSLSSETIYRAMLTKMHDDGFWFEILHLTKD